MPRIGTRLLHHVLFAVVLYFSAIVLTGDLVESRQVLIWLPTGVAVAGVWLLGLRSAWVVTACVLVQRLQWQYHPLVAVTAALGSTAEAFIAVLLLRRLKVRGEFASLREVLVLLAIAAIVPLPSMALSWTGRQIADMTHLAMFSGWDGWWRMNVLGLMTLVPSAMVWLGPHNRTLARARLVPCALTGAFTTCLVAVVMLGVVPSAASVLLLTMVLPISLCAALRLGTHGSITTATVGTIVITAFASNGIGSFEGLPLVERHVASQILAVALVSVPLVFGALIAEREATTTQWLESEAMRRAMVNALPDVMYTLRSDGTFVDAMVPSGAGAPIPPSQLIGRRIQDLMPPDIGSAMTEQIGRALRGQPTTPVEYPLTTPQGRREREIRFVPLPGENVLGVVRDITARKGAQRQLATHARALEMIAGRRPQREVLTFLVSQLEAAMPESMCSVLLLHGKRLSVGCAPKVPAGFSALAEGLEIGPERGSCGTAAFENRTVITVDVTTDPNWVAFVDATVKHGIRSSWSVPVRAPDGTVLGTFALYHAEPRSPTPEEVAAVERAAMLAGLAIDRERREGLLAAIQRNISEGLFRSMPEAGLVHANDAFARLFGYPSPEAMRELLAAGNHRCKEHAESLTQLTATMESRSQHEVELHRRDGSRFPALVSTTIVLDSNGKPVACDGTVADITSRKQLEEQLRQAQKMEAVGQLAGGVAHDFNNLLTAITGFADSVHEELPPGSPLRSDVNEILKAADRAAGLTRQLLAFGRRQVMTPRVVDLVPTVDQTSDMLRRLIGEHITLSIHHKHDRVFTRVDRGQLEQVLLNLVLNARDALPNGGTVTIGTDDVVVDAAKSTSAIDLPPGRYAVLRVTDDGIGMPADVLARAFDPFFTTKEPGKGTGLGLSTVYGIVHQSGGAIRIDSRPQGGTTVWIHLPHVAEEPQEERAVTIPRPHADKATVLVVEDEPLVRELAQRALVRAGHTVLTASNGQEALDRVAERDGAIDAVVSDVVMPYMSGRELRARLSTAWPRIPVLLMSGYAHETTNPAEQATILHKPFTASGLLQASDTLLATHGARATDLDAPDRGNAANRPLPPVVS